MLRERVCWSAVFMGTAMMVSSPAQANDAFTNDGLASPETLSDSVPDRSGVSRGSWSDSVAIDVPQGKAGHGPRVAVVASPSVSNGILGSGWMLNASESVRRRSSGNGIPSDSSTVADVFYWNGQQLFEQTDGVSTWFEPEVYDGSKFEYSPPLHLWVRSKDGHTWYYGESGGMGALDLIDPTQPVWTRNSAEWHLQKHIDPYGNEVLYSYSEAAIPTSLLSGTAGGALAVSRTNETLLSMVSWAAGEAELVLSYEDRLDPYYSSHSGRNVLHTQRLSELRVSAGGAHFSRYSVDYHDSDCGTPGACAELSELAHLIQRAGAVGASGNDLVLRAAEYTKAADSWTEHTSTPDDYAAQLPSPIYGDGEHTSAYIGNHWTIPMAVNLDGDAFSDFVVFAFKCSRPPTTVSSGPSVAWDYSASLGEVGSCTHASGTAYQNVDSSGAAPGPFGIGEVHEPHFSSGTVVANDWNAWFGSNISLSTWNATDGNPFDFVDLDADGQVELLSVDNSGSSPVVTETTYDRASSSFTSLPSTILVEDFKHGTFADVDGDGKADLVVKTNPDHPSSAGTVWYKNQGGSPALFTSMGALALPLEDLPSAITASGFQAALNCGYVSGTTDSDCSSAANLTPLNQMPDFSASEYYTNQARLSDINGDGILDVAYSLYLSWTEEEVSAELRQYSVEVLDCLETATADALGSVDSDDCDTVTETHVFWATTSKDVPDLDSAYSRIFYGDGRGGFYDSGLSAGQPWMAHVDYSGLGDPALKLAHTFANNAAFIDVNRSGQAELIQVNTHGSATSGVPYTQLAAARIHNGIAQGYELTSSGSVGAAADDARAVGTILPMTQIGAQFPLPHSTLSADWDGDGFVDFLEMTPSFERFDILGLVFYNWEVNLHLNDRQQPTDWTERWIPSAGTVICERRPESMTWSRPTSILFSEFVPTILIMGETCSREQVLSGSRPSRQMI